jgi:ubiquinone/menaquinone biosynthesis C-methylase UbiE
MELSKLSEDEYEALQREYSRIALRYDNRWHSYIEACTRETLRRLHMAPEVCVLDVGCGTGAFLASLAHASPHARLTGVDLSWDMLQVARHRLGSETDLSQTRAEALPFATASFDVVVSTSAFHFIRHPVAALAEMLRVLKPSGRIVVTDWCRDYFSCRVCDIYLRAVSRAHFRTYGRQEFHEFFQEAGIADVKVEQYKINWWWGLMTATATKNARSD